MFRVAKGKPSAVHPVKLRSLFLAFPDILNQESIWPFIFDIVYRESIPIAVIPDMCYRKFSLTFPQFMAGIHPHRRHSRHLLSEIHLGFLSFEWIPATNCGYDRRGDGMPATDTQV